MTSRDDAMEGNIILFILAKKKQNSKNALFIQKLIRTLIIIRLVDTFFHEIDFIIVSFLFFCFILTKHLNLFCRIMTSNSIAFDFMATV